MRIDKDGAIVEFNKKERLGRRIVIPPKAVKFGDNIMGSIMWLAHHPKEKIEVEEGNPVFYMQGGCLIDRNTKTLVLAEIGATIPADGSVEHIGEYAFCDRAKIHSFHNDAKIDGLLIIPDGVKTIGFSAFEDCTSIFGLVIPASVEQISPSAFNGCDGLECIAVRKGNPKYRAEGECMIETATGTVVVGCKASEIPEGITAIGEGAFSDIETLENIAIPNSVKKIGDGAFEYCTSLKHITLPEKVDSLGSDVFRGCTSLESIRIPYGVEFIDMYTFKECGMLKEVSIPESVTSIELGAFEDCYSLEEIEIPGSVEYIGQWAFYNCRSLKKVVLKEGIKAIYEEAFAGCAFAELILPASLEEIGDGAFRVCAHLNEIVIPKDVKRIGKGAFEVCASLKSVVFKAPSGWVYNGRPLKEEELRDPATAAEFLRHKYFSFDWEKKT